jgi:hypothetical protein
MIMTEYKAQKIAIRERMARTGEPYSVARRAVLSRPDTGEPAGAWPNWIPKPWNEEIPEGRPWDEEIPEGKPWDEDIPEDSLAAGQPPPPRRLRRAADRGGSYRSRDQVCSIRSCPKL